MFAVVAPFALGIVAALIMICITWSSRNTRIGRYYLKFTATMLWWSFFYVIELLSTNKGTALFYANIQFLSIAFMPGYWFLLVRAHLGMPTMARPAKFALFLPGIITLILAVTDPWLGLLRHNPVFAKVSQGSWVINAHYGLWHDAIFLPYIYIIITVSSILLWTRVRTMPSYYRLPTQVLALVPVPVCIAGIIYHFGYSPVPHVNYAIAVFSVMSVPVCWGIYRKKWLNLTPQARDLVISSMQDGVVVVDRDQLIIDYNRAAEMLLAIDLAHNIGHPIQKMIPYVDRTEQMFQIGDRSLQYTEHVIRDRTGEGLGRLYVFSDISAEIRLRKLLQIAVQMLPNPTVVVQDGQVVQHSISLENCFGYEPSQFQDFHGWARQVMPNWPFDSSSPATTAPVEYVLHCADGSQKRVQVASADLGEMITWTLTDITERYLAGRKLQEALHDLEHTNQELQSFAYVISHDLKAPLRAITNISQWMQEDYAEQLDDAGKEQLGLLVERSMRLSTMIDGVLRYSRMNSRDYVVDLVNTESMIRSIIMSLAVPQGTEVTVNPLPNLYGDAVRLEQVFQNLLSNAIKFINRPDGLVEVSYDPNQNSFCVRDNGPGIPLAERERVFTLFATGSNRTEDSTGVGLALVKRVVEMYGGHIGLESPEQGGCGFWFSLPKCMKRPEQADLQIEEV